MEIKKSTTLDSMKIVESKLSEIIKKRCGYKSFWGADIIPCIRIDVPEFRELFYNCRDEFIHIAAKEKICPEHQALIQVRNKKSSYKDGVELYVSIYLFDYKTYPIAKEEIGDDIANLYPTVLINNNGDRVSNSLFDNIDAEWFLNRMIRRKKVR